MRQRTFHNFLLYTADGSLSEKPEQKTYELRRVKGCPLRRDAVSPSQGYVPINNKLKEQSAS